MEKPQRHGRDSNSRKHEKYATLQNYLQKVVGLCHLVLLVATLGQFIFTLISLPPDLTTLEYNNTTSSQKPAEATFEALASVVQGINIAGQICFEVILVGVVQTFFEIRAGQALFITSISCAIYWVLSEILRDVLLRLFLFWTILGSELAVGQPDFTVT